MGNNDDDLDTKVISGISDILKRSVGYVGGKFLIASASAKVGQIIGGVIMPELLASPDTITYWRSLGFMAGSYICFWSAYIASHWKDNYKPILMEKGIASCLKEVSKDFIAVEIVYAPIITIGGIGHGIMSKHIGSAASYVITAIGVTLAGGRWNNYYRGCKDSGGLIYASCHKLSSLFGHDINPS